MTDRSIRVEKRSILRLADGSTLTLDPGDYALRLGGVLPALLWKQGARQRKAMIEDSEITRHVALRNLVYTSW